VDTQSFLRIREIRDGFFHQVKEKPIQHEHYCYGHETVRQKGNTGYGHHATHDQLESHEGRALPTGTTGWCIEGRGIVLDSVPDAKPQEAQ